MYAHVRACARAHARTTHTHELCTPLSLRFSPRQCYQISAQLIDWVKVWPTLICPRSNLGPVLGTGAAWAKQGPGAADGVVGEPALLGSSRGAGWGGRLRGRTPAATVVVGAGCNSQGVVEPRRKEWLSRGRERRWRGLRVAPWQLCEAALRLTRKRLGECLAGRWRKLRGGASSCT